MRLHTAYPIITMILFSFVIGAGACDEDPNIATLPVADAGFDETVSPGTEVTLDGSQSHDPAAAEELSFQWTLVSVPDGSLADLLAATTDKPSFTPDEPGDYIASLTVSNSRRSSLPDIVAIHAINNAVVASADCVGGVCEVTHGAAGSVDGRLSGGGTGASLTYTWTQITSTTACAAACPGISACNPVTETVTWTTDDAQVGVFTAPCALGDLVFELSVTDGETTGTDCVSLTSINTAPVARADMSGTPIDTSGVPYEIDDTETFTLSGSNSSDDDSACDTTLTYAWTQTSPTTPLATMAIDDQEFINVTVPDVTANTIFEFQLVVSDGADTSETPCTTFSSSGACGARILVLDAN